MRFTLLTDGSSDRALLPILRWLLGQHASVPFEPAWADRPDVHVHRLAELIDDFSPLRRLSAFQALEAELTQVLAELGCLAVDTER